MNTIDLLEGLMILLFGLSWPTSIMKSYRSRTAKGKSILFEVLIWVGYVFGIARKVLQYKEYVLAGKTPDFLFWFAWIFYVINICSVTIDMILYIRNRKLDKKREAGELMDGI